MPMSTCTPLRHGHRSLRHLPCYAQAKILSLDLGKEDTQRLKDTKVVRTMYQLLRNREQLPSLGWYWANAAAQVRGTCNVW